MRRADGKIEGFRTLEQEPLTCWVGIAVTRSGGLVDGVTKTEL